MGVSVVGSVGRSQVASVDKPGAVAWTGTEQAHGLEVAGVPRVQHWDAGSVGFGHCLAAVVVYGVDSDRMINTFLLNYVRRENVLLGVSACMGVTRKDEKQKRIKEKRKW